MNKKIICFVGIGIASLCVLIGVVLLIQNMEKRSGEELCRTGVLNYERGNRDEAVKCWEKAADKGDVLALLLLARCYENGDGGVEQDLTKAAELYCKAAARRNGDSEREENKKYELGFRYTKGLGVNRDNERAMFWFSAAAAEGHLGAVGALYAMGSFFEITNDKKNAIKCYRMAADKGFHDAKVALERLGLSSE